MFGNARKQPADPSYTIPANRRVIWEHGQDLALFLTVSVIFNILFTIAIVVMSMVLINIYQRPPYILTQDEGFIMYRSTEVFKLRTDMIRSYLDVTTGTILTINPGGYDITSVASLVHPRVIDYYNKQATAQAETRAKSNFRQLWRILGVRRYYDKKLKRFIGLAIRGEKVIYQEYTTSTGVRDVKTTTTRSLIIVYLSQTRPSPKNPWGLILEGISEIPDKDVARAEALWQESKELANTKDQAGRNILDPPPREEDQGAKPNAP